MRPMTTLIEDVKPGTGHSFGRPIRVGDRDYLVLSPPNHHHWRFQSVQFRHQNVLLPDSHQVYGIPDHPDHRLFSAGHVSASMQFLPKLLGDELRVVEDLVQHELCSADPRTFQEFAQPGDRYQAYV